MIIKTRAVAMFAEAAVALALDERMQIVKIVIVQITQQVIEDPRELDPC
jgi:hypothetical protein